MNKRPTILVTGSTGQLGQSIQSIRADHLDYEFVFTSRQQIDLSNETSIADFFECNTFDIVINCAAYTAVDKAESEPELANQINHLAVRQLAIIAKKHHTCLLYTSDAADVYSV